MRNSNFVDFGSISGFEAAILDLFLNDVLNRMASIGSLLIFSRSQIGSKKSNLRENVPFHKPSEG